MDTRVKERLVGAVLLVGIIVALVPEMLRGPRHETAAPAPDGQLRTVTIDLTPSATDANSPPREVAPADSPTVAPTPQASPPSLPGPGSLPQASQSQDSPAHEVVKPPATSAPAVETPPPVARTARATAALETGWVVQLGSFASRENAERLAKDERARGYRAFVSRFDSGKSVRYRVRVGPEQDRSKAEALAQRLRRDGRQASVVAHP